MDTIDLTQREADILALVANGLSNKEIAAQLHLTLQTVKWYNKQIFRKLNVASRSQAILKAKSLSQAHETYKPEQDSLPSITTRFVGREKHLQEIKHYLLQTRLLTLLGTGGVGKTRLAIQVAYEVKSLFRDGVFFITLAPLQYTSLVPAAIAKVLNINEEINKPLIQTLQAALADKATLLILDNIEHIIETRELISDLLLAAPRLKILVTSRSVLKLYGEQIYPVKPMSVSLPAHFTALDDLKSVEAIALFIDRAKLANAAFEPDAYTLQAIADICTYLEGLPLAIELAAARIRTLSVRHILQRLDNRLSFLQSGAHDQPPRQQTLRQTLDWSYDLLNPAEQQLLCCIAIFRAGFSLPAVEFIYRDQLNISAEDVLCSLADKSLIYPVESLSGQVRFQMLETIREYCLEKLGDKALALRHRLAEYFAQFAHDGNQQLKGGASQKLWYNYFHEESENLTDVLQWSIDQGNVEVGLALVADMVRYWDTRTNVVEGYHWLEKILTVSAGAAPALRARALAQMGRLAIVTGHDQKAQSILQQALELYQGISGEQHLSDMAWAFTFYGHITFDAQPIEQALNIFKAISDIHGLAWALNILGEQKRASGDIHAAASAYLQSLEYCQQINSYRLKAYLMHNLGQFYLATQNLRVARQHFWDGLLLGKEIDSSSTYIICFAGLMTYAVRIHHYELAGWVMVFTEILQEKTGKRLEPVDRQVYEQSLYQLYAEIAATKLEVLKSQAHAMSIDEMLTCLNEMLTANAYESISG